MKNKPHQPPPYAGRLPLRPGTFMAVTIDSDMERGLPAGDRKDAYTPTTDLSHRLYQQPVVRLMINRA